MEALARSHREFWQLDLVQRANLQKTKLASKLEPELKSS